MAYNRSRRVALAKSLRRKKARKLKNYKLHFTKQKRGSTSSEFNKYYDSRSAYKRGKSWKAKRKQRARRMGYL